MARLLAVERPFSIERLLLALAGIFWPVREGCQAVLEADDEFAVFLVDEALRGEDEDAVLVTLLGEDADKSQHFVASTE